MPPLKSLGRQLALCPTTLPRFDRVVRLGPYAPPLRTIVRELKYRRRVELVARMGGLLAQAVSAAAYFEDGSIEAAIPPLKAVLHVMAKGHYEGKSIHDPEVRALFDRDGVIGSAWYRERLEDYRDRESAYIATSVERLRRYLAESAEAGSVAARRARAELARTEERMEVLGQAGYIDMIVGSIGLDPLFRTAKTGVKA